MEREASFGPIVRERRRALDLTQDELARRVGCAAVTIRKIEADDLRPSLQIAERLAMALAVPLEERAGFVRLARSAPRGAAPRPIPTPPPLPDEIGLEDLSGRAIRGYALGERIGTGGFGAVYRAVQPLVERAVAIKIILPQYANHPDFIRRFEAEAQLVARLEHPHIVPLYDYWREPGVAYLVMRQLRGGSLHDALQGGPLALDAVARLLEQIGAALHTAHRAGVIHRDLKPANVLLDEDGNAYLADFGIAKNLGNPNLEDQTQAGAIVGSPAYLAPEQIRAEPVRPQTDIYCLGIMLYELLTGTLPFQGPTPIALLLRHLNESMPSLAAHRPGLPERLDSLIARATAKDPLDRYPDVLSLLDDLRNVLTSVRGPWSLVRDQPTTNDQLLTTDHGLPTTLLNLTEADNPYKGLRAFGEADAGDFFGREALTQQLLARLAEGGDLARFLAVIGPSGSGKSSVVRAGLIPALRRGGLPGSEHWFVAELLPGAHPLEELAAALRRIAVVSAEDLVAQLRADERGLLRAARQVLPDDDATELVLVIDQFEEVFTLVENEAERAHLLNSLVATVLDEHSRVRVVVTLRADFVDRPLRYTDFGELVRQRNELVLPLTPEELERAIVGPAERVGLAIAPGLAAAIVRDVGDQPGTLPLLQYALTELFERREGRRLTVAAYQATGGVVGALARRADELYLELDEAGQEAARQLFLRLITPGEGVEDTRRRVLRSELTGLTNDEQLAHRSSFIAHRFSQMEAVIDIYGRYRLLTFDRDPLTRGPTVEVAHEALIRAWGRLRGWLDTSREELRMQRRMATTAAEWIAAGRDTSFLATGARLAQFEVLAESGSLMLNEEERSYLQASLDERDRHIAAERARKEHEMQALRNQAETEQHIAAQLRRRALYLAGALALALIAAIAAGVFATNNATLLANSERLRLAAEASVVLDRGESGDVAALLALRSLRSGYTTQADGALLKALGRGMTRQRFIGHTGPVIGAAFSPDGNYVLTGSGDNTARLWDASSGQEIRQFMGHSHFIIGVAFSPDGNYVLTGSLDNTARLWNVATGQQLRVLSHGASVDGVAFSPDGKYLLTGSVDGITLLWDAATGEMVRRFVGPASDVTDVAFSPNGTYILIGGDSTARMWATATGQEVRQFKGHTDHVITDPVFSPDGKYLLTAGDDKTIRLWEVATGQQLRQFSGLTQIFLGLAFSPDGKYILAGGDGTAQIWHMNIEDVVQLACSELVRDLTPEERAAYSIADDTPACPQP